MRINLNILRAVCVFIVVSAVPAWAVTHYVDPNGSGDFISIQAAITASSGGDTIIVMEGTYVENINMGGKAITLQSTDPNDPDIVEGTIIDGNGIGSVIICNSGEGPNTEIEGFLIRNGTGTFLYGEYVGGGMYNLNGSPTVTNCTFSGNGANQYGGGMYNLGGNPAVTNCTFSGNSAGWAGGGMWNYQGSPTVTNCTFSGNTANDEGGGMFNKPSSPIVNNCKFSGNTARNGGGMFNNGGSVTVTNCTFSGNGAIRDGGGMYNLYSNPAVTNCTFSGNTAYDGGGMNNDWSSPTVTNCILWRDEPDEIFNNNSNPTVAYSDVQGGYAGTGNIDADPLFVDPINPNPNLLNLRLKPDSPCIDAGDSTNVLAIQVVYDLDGKDRYVDIDTIDDTGSGLFEFLDMGAYEFDCSGINGDINCDWVVDFKDVAILCGNWLEGK